MIKKKSLIIGIIFILGICVVIYIQDLKKYPYCYAESSDGKWRLYGYIVYEGGDWTGDLYYEGNKTGDIGVIDVKINYNGDAQKYGGKIKPRVNGKGDAITKDRFINENKEKYYLVWEFGGVDIPEVILKINWMEGKTSKSAVLKPEIRYGGPTIRKIWSYFK